MHKGKVSAVLEAEVLEGKLQSSLPALDPDQIEDGEFTEVTKPQIQKAIKPKQHKATTLMSKQLLKAQADLKTAQATLKEQNAGIKDLRGEVRDAKAAAKEPLAALKTAERDLERGLTAKTKTADKIIALKDKIAELKAG